MMLSTHVAVDTIWLRSCIAIGIILVVVSVVRITVIIACSIVVIFVALISIVVTVAIVFIAFSIAVASVATAAISIVAVIAVVLLVIAFIVLLALPVASIISRILLLLKRRSTARLRLRSCSRGSLWLRRFATIIAATRRLVWRLLIVRHSQGFTDVKVSSRLSSLATPISLVGARAKGQGPLGVSFESCVTSTSDTEGTVRGEVKTSVTLESR